MGGHDDVLHVPERMVRRQGFPGEHIHAGAGDGFTLQGIDESRFIYHRGPGNIDEKGGRFHGLEFFRIEEVFRFRCGWKGSNDDIRLRQDIHDFFLGIHMVRKEFLGQVFLHSQDMGLEDFGPLGDGAADAAESYDEDGLAEKGLSVGTHPFMGRLAADGIGNAAEPGQEQGHGVFRHGPVMDAVGVGEDNGAAHHAGGQQFFYAI